MTGHRHLEERLRAWTSFRGVARATRTLAAAKAQRWGEHVVRAEAYTSWCAELQRAYAPADPPPRTYHAVIAIGSDHGLCGSLNRLVAEALGVALEAEPAPALTVVIGSRVSSYIDLDDVTETELDAPSSFARTLELSARIQGLLAAKASLELMRVSLVSPCEVGPDGAVTVSTYDIHNLHPEVELPPAFTARAPVELSPRIAARARTAALFLHAALVEALCRAARCEAEARWRTMSRAHDAADRRIEEHSLRLRRLKQEGITQEMLEARQGQRRR